jgi:ACS family hexuronate transporter-like MFS transporter
VNEQSGAGRYRWLVLSVFVLSSAINYLDRQTFATLAPAMRDQFHLTAEQYGAVLSVFSIAYAASALFAGMLIDRIGLNLAASLAVGLWSCAGIATGFTRGLTGLMGCRTVLGVAEAAGVPAAGKAIHQYLRPSERAMGNAVNQAGVSLGLIGAPPFATWIAVAYGWRAAFVITGCLSLLWVPLWNWTASRTAVAAAPRANWFENAKLLRDHRLWSFALANALTMVGYSLWTNWTMLYLVDVHHLTLRQAAGYAWIPPVFALLGGFGGGWLSLRLTEQGLPTAAARFRVCVAAASVSLLTAAIPAAHAPSWTTAGIALSFFAISAQSTNVYSLPLDVFGAKRAAFGVAALVASYGAMQAVVSPLFGWIQHHHGYAPLTWIAAVTPAAACVVLRLTRSVS